MRCSRPSWGSASTKRSRSGEPSRHAITTGGALEAQRHYRAAFGPPELYICSDPCPTDASSCEMLSLTAAEGERVRSTQSFAPGTVLHLAAPAAPNPAYFTIGLRIAPDE